MAFEDSGFPPDEAAVVLARETRLIELEKELRKREKKQRELGVSRTRVFEAMHRKTDRFSMGKRVDLPHRAGKRAELRVC